MELTKENFIKALEIAGHDNYDAKHAIRVGMNAISNIRKHGIVPKGDNDLASMQKYVNKWLKKGQS